MKNKQKEWHPATKPLTISPSQGLRIWPHAEKLACTLYPAKDLLSRSGFVRVLLCPAWCSPWTRYRSDPGPHTWDCTPGTAGWPPAQNASRSFLLRVRDDFECRLWCQNIEG